jgi:hypothetical protein
VIDPLADLTAHGGRAEDAFYVANLRHEGWPREMLWDSMITNSGLCR